MLLCSLVCLVFGMVYEHFSFGVYSFYMVYAFVPSLLAFFLYRLLDQRLGRGKEEPLLSAGIITLTVGSIIGGILEIYGTTNRWMVCYPLLGGGMCLFGMIGVIGGLVRRNRRREAEG